MYIIVGLGNPEKKYESTRHNAGFRVIDKIAASHDIAFTKQQSKAAVGSGFIGGEKVLLVKPLTYMNNSGEAVRPLCDYYKVDPENELIVISDDTDLGVGTVRLRGRGSAGGHNGLKSIITHLGTEDFMRVRVGVGHRKDYGDQIEHVLTAVPPDEREILEEAEDRAAKGVCAIITDGIARAMNFYNTKKKKNREDDKDKEENENIEEDKNTEEDNDKEDDNNIEEDKEESDSADINIKAEESVICNNRKEHS